MQAIQRQSANHPPVVVPVAIYTRVSTLHQVGGRFDSCESQAAICRDFIRKHAHEGWHEVACYTDAAYSGGSMNRPGIQALKRQIAAGEIKVVVIFKLERVLRSTDEWGPFRAFLSQHGCRLVSTTEDLSEETPSGRLKNNLLVSVAEYERLNTAEKVRAKLAELAKRGIWNCGLVPYGYRYDATAKALHPHPIEADIVRRIYADAARLVSLTELANALNEEGRRTRDRVFQRRDGTRENVGGKRFKSDALRNLIRNPIYAGRIRFHGQEYPGQHEAIVTADIWERSNAAVTKSLQPARCWLKTSDKNGHLLKGLAFCVHCGRAMIPNACGKRDLQGKYYRYYTCGRVHKEKADCPVRHVSADLLELTVIEFLGALARHPEVVRETLASASTRGQADRTELRARLAGIDPELAQLHKRLGHVIEVIAAGGADVLGDELRTKAAALKDDKQRLLVEREKIRQALLLSEQDRFDAERLLAALARFRAVFSNLTPAEQKDLVALCVECVELRASPAGDERPGLRQYVVRLKLHVTRLVESMEEKIVVERNESHEPPPAQRALTLEPRVVFRSWGRSPSAVIVAPFREEFRAAKPAADAHDEPPTVVHPIHRALAWQRKLAANPDVTQSALARRERVTGATLTYHLKLLSLVPEIQAFLLRLKTAPEFRRFSLRKMMVLAELSADAQRRRFAAMRPNAAPGTP